MTTLDQIIAHSQALPESAQQEVLRFITSLEARQNQATQSELDEVNAIHEKLMDEHQDAFERLAQ